MFFGKVYNIIFEVEEEIPPGTFTGYSQWYGEQKTSIERLLTVHMLNKFINQGRFDGPGKYHLQVYRKRFRPIMHAHLGKFPPNATEETIKEYYEILRNLKENYNG